MSCTKNPKKFLFINYQGCHHFELKHVTVFMLHHSKDFQTINECKHCGLVLRRSFVEGSDLMQTGVTADELEEARRAYGGVTPSISAIKNEDK